MLVFPALSSKPLYPEPALLKMVKSGGHPDEAKHTCVQVHTSLSRKWLCRIGAAAT